MTNITIDDILTEAIKKKSKTDTAVVAFGRFNPITKGHESMVNDMLDFAKKHKGDALLFASISQDNKKNPLDFETKIKYLKKFFPQVQVFDEVGEDGVKTLLGALYKVSRAGYKKVFLVAGEDRAENFNDYIGKRLGDLGFESLEFYYGPRPEGGISATLLRKAAMDGDFETFSKGMPSRATARDAKTLFDAVRTGLGADELDEAYERIGETISLVESRQERNKFLSSVSKTNWFQSITTKSK